jgi:serine O-acetyltransferase
MSFSELGADAFRQSGRGSFASILRLFFISRSFRPVATLRLCQMCSSRNLMLRVMLPIFKILHKLTCQLAGVDLAWSTKIGAGFAITHGWGLVVSPGAEIGRNVTIFHGATLGRGDRIARDGKRQTGYPTIGDEVWIGPGAIIVGGINIGAGSRICGGAYVTEDVPALSVVIGNPARVVKENCTPDVMNKVDFA